LSNQADDGSTVNDADDDFIDLDAEVMAVGGAVAFKINDIELNFATAVVNQGGQSYGAFALGMGGRPGKEGSGSGADASFDSHNNMGDVSFTDCYGITTGNISNGNFNNQSGGIAVNANVKFNDGK